MQRTTSSPSKPLTAGSTMANSEASPTEGTAREARSNDVLVLIHLYGMKLRHKSKGELCNAAVELVELLPPGSFQLTDDAEEALKGNVDHLGIRLTSADHVIDSLDKAASDKRIFGDVMTYLVHN